MEVDVEGDAKKEKKTHTWWSGAQMLADWWENKEVDMYVPMILIIFDVQGDECILGGWG